MTDELKQQHSADAELRKLIEDAAKLLGIEGEPCVVNGESQSVSSFDPLDPESGDLMKVAEAAKLMIDFEESVVYTPSSVSYEGKTFTNHNSLALAILRAASAVWRARGGEETKAKQKHFLGDDDHCTECGLHWCAWPDVCEGR